MSQETRAKEIPMTLTIDIAIYGHEIENRLLSFLTQVYLQGSEV